MALTGLPHLVWLAIASHRESHGWRGLKVSAKPCHANKLTERDKSHLGQG
jgi:hypothetical protein